MGFRLKVTGGGEEISFDERAILDLDFVSDSPNDSNARATDFGVSVKIKGKMLYKLGAESDDHTIKLAKWSQVPSEIDHCYRNAEIQVIAASKVVRKYVLPEAFIMEYTEELDDETGVGIFYIHMKQKKDENAKVEINGGFDGE